MLRGAAAAANSGAGYPSLDALPRLDKDEYHDKIPGQISRLCREDQAFAFDVMCHGGQAKRSLAARLHRVLHGERIAGADPAVYARARAAGDFPTLARQVVRGLMW